jgi:hydrogenase small subunit
MIVTSEVDKLLEMDRRAFVSLCAKAAVAVGLPWPAALEMAQAVSRGARTPVMWLTFQGCTGCTESLLRSSHPDVAELILDVISLDYHETLLTGAGKQAEAALISCRTAGKYILVVEGAVPTGANAAYCKIGGRTAVDLLHDAAEGADAIVAIGSCASFGGLPAADPNPTAASGIRELLPGKTVVSIPGCPPNPYNFLGTLLQYITFGTLPALDDEGRPKFAYDRTIHEHCPRRAHFEAGRFAQRFGDEASRNGYCLFMLGCKGPRTHSNCPAMRYGDVNMWPTRAGHPCVGCTERAIAFRFPISNPLIGSTGGSQ